jgi:hypothetical protein
MSQIYLHIVECPQDFPTDDEKIFYVRLYLRSMAQKGFQPNIFAGRQVPILHWDGNWELFVQELASNFSPHNPFGDTQISWESLSMKPGDWLATCQLKFDTHVVITRYNEAALYQVYYCGLPSRLKDTMAQNQLPASLARLEPLASQLDQWYHRRNSEHTTANLPPAGKSSSNTSSALASGSDGSSGKSKGKGKSGGKSNSPPKANSPANDNVAQASGSKQAKPYAAKLDSSGKLKPKEDEQRMKNNLCMFCGGAGHKMAECHKCPANAQGKTVTVSNPTPAAADASSSKSKNRQQLGYLCTWSELC